MSYKLNSLVGGKKKKEKDEKDVIDDYTFSPESQAVYNELFAKPDPNVLNAYDKTFGTTAKKSENLANQYGENKFQYNPATDPNYQAYLKLAKENAGLAMQDTLAKASAMTGGYSNSNAQLAGQKVYNQRLSEAEGRVGDFYAMALDAFNAEQNTLLNQIELAWAAEDRDKQNAQFKAEYGDYSGLVDLGVSREAVDKYKANADWATQYAKDSAAYEKAWKLAEATGDYADVYKQLGYTDEQIAALKGSMPDKQYAALDWIDREYNISPQGFVTLTRDLPPGVSIELLMTGAVAKSDSFEDALNIPFFVDARTGSTYTLGETIKELEKAKLPQADIIEFLVNAVNNA